MYCRNCGKEVSQQAKFCLNCGVPPGKGSNYCISCGTPMEKEAIVCIKCGAQQRLLVIGEVEKVEKASSMSLASMIIGIVSLVIPCCAIWIPIFNILGSLLCLGGGITAVVLGFKEKAAINRGIASKKGFPFALTGIITGFFSIFGSIILLLIAVIWGFAIFTTGILSSLNY